MDPKKSQDRDGKRRGKHAGVADCRRTGASGYAKHGGPRTTFHPYPLDRPRAQLPLTTNTRSASQILEGRVYQRASNRFYGPPKPEFMGTGLMSDSHYSRTLLPIVHHQVPVNSHYMPPHFPFPSAGLPHHHPTAPLLHNHISTGQPQYFVDPYTITYPPIATSIAQPGNFSSHIPQATAANKTSNKLSGSKDKRDPSTIELPMATRSTRCSPVIARTPVKNPSCDDEQYYPSDVSERDGDDGEAVNVYIKGLPVDMTDKRLSDIVAPYGDVISSKAIIDRPHGICKGYGFAKYTTKEAAKACMRGLEQTHNFEATIARDSFYAKLKEAGDPGSTKLYVSNIPTNWSEGQILDIFNGYKYGGRHLLFEKCSGAFRGVAFIDFIERRVCDEIIEKLNGFNFGQPNHHLTLSVRYADTKKQREIKRELEAFIRGYPKNHAPTQYTQSQRPSLDGHHGGHHADKKPSRRNTSAPSGYAPYYTPSRPSCSKNQKHGTQSALTKPNWRSTKIPINSPPTPPQSETGEF
ncbi:hypothetical protein TWF696_003122 [Orbilia brochopaga]|uniref:RRM domain-containing protein n=1 Tax=Orbilia brochopaga TaxID=3140254 RepID=A0AAV9U212_9PEZI